MRPALPRPHRDDVRIAALGLLGGLLLWALGLGMNTGRLLNGSWLLLPLVAMAGLELVRRTRPWFAVGAGTLVLVADQCTQGSLATVLMYTDLVYAAVLYGSPAAARRIPVGCGLVTVAATLGTLAVWHRPEALIIGVAVGLVTFTPAATGVLVRRHRETAATERLRAEQTALLAEIDRTQAVTAERARMARELHDMVANHLSAIAIHSTAALSLDDPATTRTALETIRENSVDGLAEMRRLIGILRETGGDKEPAAAPTLDGLGALVEQSRGNGLDAALTVTGPVEGLPAPTGLAAYRIVQESLTNALKHAAPGRVTVEVERTDEWIEVRVTSPYGDRDGPRAPGSGAGLVGMRERTALLGGTFESGPEDSDRGKVWRVSARLPLEGVTE
ncbi:sensor histidine kinase [Streptomyces sp. VRA16 Mangrove soil]|uniref:sensor histidine kinase n=1 Tax=Streptomyces sp. VRA16 Mangrove soil TaxID=2817434 RepID=UPI001A9E25B3|nr:histidine kinase [Streptomyces sp. VRA16 Mangrove soil]MBO1336224.1 two-component sensor histidine kinase [Streptomyces sp. VRA16 Mangrove soil]